MKKKTILLLIGCFLSSVVVVSVLFIISEDRVHRYNSFLRQFPPHTLQEGDTLDIEYNSYYLAGGTAHHAYLGNFTSPLNLIVLNTTSLDTQHVILKVRNIDTMKFWALRVKVDSPYFYLVDGAVPAIFCGDVNNWRADRTVFDSAFFIDTQPIAPASFAIRSISSKTNEFTIGKLGARIPHVTLAPDLLQKQIDGRFCVDGMLHYNKRMSRLIYLYYYRNQYIVADTNLNLLYRARTIDTVSRAHLQIASIGSEHSRALAAPPLMVNKLSCVSEDDLFVLSALLSKNEKRETFDTSSVFDVYSLRDKAYRFSFYIPDYHGYKVRDFRVFEDDLVVLFDHFAITYRLSPFYFNRS